MSDNLTILVANLVLTASNHRTVIVKFDVSGDVGNTINQEVQFKPGDTISDIIPRALKAIKNQNLGINVGPVLEIKLGDKVIFDPVRDLAKRFM